MTETPIYGKNLCNLLVNEIIRDYYRIDSNHITEITLIDVNNFLILKGCTSINTPINYSNLLSKYLNDKFDIDMHFNVIDLIEYNKKSKSNLIIFNTQHNTNLLSNVIKTYDLKYQGYFSIDNTNQRVLHNNDKLKEFLFSENNYNDYEFHHINDVKFFYSDSFFGKNLFSDKIFDVYFKYITFNLFEKQLLKDITYEFYYKGNLNDITWENISLNISSNSSIVNVEWLHSLILDIFDFNPNSIKKHLSLENYNFENEIISNDKCWKLNDKVKELILL